MTLAEALRQNGVPLYHQLKEIFSDKIANGEWRPGEMIPNELQLCEQYGVSRGPIRQALDHLVREGLLIRKQGKGTLVLPPKIERSLGSLYSFTTLIQQRGMQPSTRLLTFEIIQGSGGIAQTLNLPPGAPTFQIRRLRLADAEPLILETVYVPEYICRSLSAEEVSSAPLYDILQKHYQVVLQRAKQFFEPTIADDYEAGALQVPKGTPALLVQNITYALGDKPVVFSKAIMRGDRVRYYVELSAQIAIP
jgi:GntR family transcriptional regulator